MEAARCDVTVGALECGLAELIGFVLILGGLRDRGDSGGATAAFGAARFADLVSKGAGIALIFFGVGGAAGAVGGGPDATCQLFWRPGSLLGDISRSAPFAVGR
jgi:hypothetical protein